MTSSRLAIWFRALADANRLRIVELLMKGERCGCEIQVALGLTQSNVSRHLACLKNAGLIEDERRGQRVFYRLASPEPDARRLYEFLRTVLRPRPGTWSGGAQLRKRTRRRRAASRVP